jgi:hypothetical protein
VRSKLVLTPARFIDLELGLIFKRRSTGDSPIRGAMECTHTRAYSTMIYMTGLMDRENCALMANYHALLFDGGNEMLDNLCLI